MPGSAVLVGVVRRLTGLRVRGHADEADAWAATVRRRALLVIAGAAVASPAVGFGIGRLLDVRAAGAAAVLVSASVWAALSVERGLLQSRLAYGALASNVFVEAAGRTAGMLLLVALDAGVVGATFGLLVGTGSSLLHARRAVDRTSS